MRQFTSPVGRMAQGSWFEPQTTDMNGKPRLIQSGPKAGQPSPQFFAALAFSKNDPLWPAFYGEIMGEAAAAWPSLFPQGPTGPCTLPTFSSKIIDGDGYDTTGKAWNTREGYAGHWIVRFGSSFAPKVFPVGHYAPHEQIFEAAQAKRGWYYRIVGTIDSNRQANKPGLYVNVAGADLCGYGSEIVTGPDVGETLSRSVAPALPAGASATPIAGPALHVTPVAPALPAAPAAPIQHAPYVAPMMAPPAPPPVPVHRMTAKAAGVTYEAFAAQGWTDMQMIQQGYMEDEIPY